MDARFAALLEMLRARFEKNMHRHKGLSWQDVEARLLAQPSKMKVLMEMDQTGGEPDVIGTGANGAIIFCDCSPECPSGRRSLCYDAESLAARKEHKPMGSAVEMARAMGISLLTEEEYVTLQALGPFDTKTSSWLSTPSKLRAMGGALFGDHRYGRTLIYHNGAQSYYAARGFRGIIKI